MHEEPRSQLEGQVRVGRVLSVDKTRHTAQVQFDEIDGFTSGDLQVLVTRPGDYSLPAIGAPVLCLLMKGRLGVGYVLGAIYTESDEAPLDNEGQRAIAGDDIRLGDPNASDKVSLAPACKKNFDDIQTEFNTIKTTLASLGGGVTTTAVFATPYTEVGYSASDPAAENVSAK